MLPLVALLFEFVVLAIVRATGTSQPGNIIGSFLILLYSFVLIGYFFKNKRLREASKSLVIAYLLRLLFLYLDLFAYPSIALPNGHSDEEMFYANAVNYCLYGINRRGPYPQIMGILFRIIGTNRLYGQYFSMLSSIVALIYFAYTLAILDVEWSIRRKIFRIVCILPNYAILSALFMREAIIYMFISMSVYELAKWMKYKKERYYFISAGLIFPAALFHSGTLAVLVGIIAIRLFYDNNNEIIRIKLTNILLTLVLAFLVVFIIGQSDGQFTGKFGTVESLEDIANTNDMGGSSYARYVGNSNNPINFILFTPIRLFFFLFSPLPVFWRGMGDVIAFCFSTLFYLITIIEVIRFMKSHVKKNRMAVITFAIVALATVFVFAWGTSNAGTATRHRDKVLILFGLLLAMSLDGLQNVLTKKQSRRNARNWR